MSEYPEGYPLRVECEYPESPSRALALAGIVFMFPKAVLLFPHIFILYFVNLACVIVVFVAFLIVLVTGRYPRGIYEFVLGTLRWQTRVSAWLFGLVDRYPPFSMR